VRKWIPLLTVCLGTFMLLIDVTIVNVALPDMVGDLNASFTSLQWVVDAYALSLAALVLGTGSIADLVGHRLSYVWGLALFAISSLVCGLAPNVETLIAARTVQGLGAAAMFATTFALLNSSYSGRDRGTAYGMWGAVAGAAAAVGPIIGGVLTQAVSWRWIFFVNIPISVVAIALCLTRLVDTHEKRKARVDVAGIVTFTAAISAIVYAMIRANEHTWSNAVTWWLMGAAAVLLVAFVLIERATPSAMLDLALFKRASFVGVMVCAVLMTFSAFAAFTYTSIWLQSVLGLSPIEAGLTGLPMSVMAFAISAAVGRFLHGNRAGLAIGGGLLFIGAGGVIGSFMMHGDAKWWALVPGFLVVGIGVGFATPTVGSAAMAAVPVERGGMAGGAVNTARQLGFAFGIAALGSVFSSRAEHVFSDRGVANAAELGRAVAGGRSGELLARDPGLSDALHAAAVEGVQWTLGVAGCVGLLAGVIGLVLIRAPKGSSQSPTAHGQAAPQGQPTAGVREPVLVGAGAPAASGMNGSGMNGTGVNGAALNGAGLNGAGRYGAGLNGSAAHTLVEQRRVVGGLRPADEPPVTEWRA
jgi:EmrB/QacA subfamily drug resistance transporter